MILDANSLIYLIKTNLQDLFHELTNKNVVIDTSVYEEVVENGIRLGYPDAVQAKNFLEKYLVPIIPINISTEINKFRDAGETSCFILAKKEGICISSDIRACKKFASYGIPSMQLDFFFYNQLLNMRIDENKFIYLLDRLEDVCATTTERKYHLLMLISKMKKE
ncbi:MAG: hypothetical protein ACTSP4_07355 [Candidatus Hodarchaeales archaeon]